MARNARLLAAVLVAVLGAAILSASVGAQALPKDALLIEHWDGAAWTVTQAPGPQGGSTLSAVTAVSPTNLWAVGSFVKTTGTTLTWHPLAEHYDGTSWSPVVLPTPNQKAQSDLVAVSGSSATDVWAVGSIGQRTLVEHYNGKAWKLVPSLRTAGSKLAGVAAVSRRDAWAVGSTGTNPGKTRTLIEHWNGIRWTEVWSPSSPSRQNGLRAVSVIGTGWNAWAVGSSLGAGGYRSLAEHWNVCSWHFASAPSPSTDALDLYGVSGLSRHDVWAVGSSGSTPQTFAEHWDGWKWTAEPTADPQIPAVLRGVAAVSADDVWAVGSSNAP